jgi:5'-nucleotidase
LEINLVAINDFHGQLEAQDKRISPSGQVARTIRVGGIDTIAGALQTWRAEDPQLLLVGAGDLLGASPALSSIWADEPTIEALNALGLRLSAVGNHEFDRGTEELLRLQRGGCTKPVAGKSCRLRGQFSGARFSYLAANVLHADNEQPWLAPYRIEEIKGVRIAFIGAVLQETAQLVNPTGIRAVRFVDEVSSINQQVRAIQAGPAVAAIVLLLHEGGRTPEAFDQVDCTQLKGPVREIVKQLDPAIRLVISGHTHEGYTCRIDDRVITQAAAFGHALTRIKLHFAQPSHQLEQISVRNVLMAQDSFTADPLMRHFLDDLRSRSQAELTRPIARIASPVVTNEMNAAGESPLGDLASDAQLAATQMQGAQIAFINSSSIRTALDSQSQAAQQVSYAQLAATHPYANSLILLTLSGAQIQALLEQQSLLGDAQQTRRALQVSAGFSYNWEASKASGQRIIADSMRLNGKPIVSTQRYRITVNSYMAQGGEGYTVLKQGTEKLDTGILDLDAITDYLVTQDKAGKPAGSAAAATRITRINQ